MSVRRFAHLVGDVVAVLFAVLIVVANAATLVTDDSLEQRLVAGVWLLVAVGGLVAFGRWHFGRARA